MEKDKKIRSDTIEAVRSDLYNLYWKSQNGLRIQKFNHAYDSEFLNRISYTNDHQIVNQMLDEWKSKLKKNDSRYKVLEDMQMALLRMYVNHQNQENTIANAITEYQIYREQNNRLLDTNEKLRNENESLKREIEFLTNG